MNFRRFGRTNWNVSEIGYGMWGMGSWSGSDDEQSLSALQLAVDLGCNFFDTAWAYGSGHSEKILGRLIKQNPGKKLYAATKVPPKNFQWPSKRDYKLEDCYPPEHIEEYLHKSLENTGIQCFDLLQLHTWEDKWLENDRWINKLDDLKEHGLIKAFGISINRWEPFNGVKAVQSGLIDAVQVIYNIFDQNPKDELLPACDEHDVAVIARVPFEEGTLTGNLTIDSKWPKGDWRNTYFVPENLSKSIEHAEPLKQYCTPEMSMPDMALRFILSEPRISTTIPGMRKFEHVRANLAASDAGPLDNALLQKLTGHRWDRTPTKWSQ